MTNLNGLIPIVPTPFVPGGELDLESLDQILNYLVDCGVGGVAVLGMASEAITLTEAERLVVIERAATTIAGRVPVVSGCNHISPEAVRVLARDSQQAGADVLMVMPPSIGRPDDTALQNYYLAAADASSAPIMIQDNPGWHGVSISMAVYRTLAAHPNIAYAKIETTHPPSTMSSVIDAVGDQLKILGGQAGIWLPEEFRRGIVGTMPAAIMPQVYGEVWRLQEAGQTAAAVALFDQFYPLIRATGTPRIGIPMAKVILHQVGVVAHETVREPFPALSDAERADLAAVVDDLRIIDIMQGKIGVHEVRSAVA